ncbi:MAG: hypothetical protein K2M25_00600 [Muribaculaceae bacterium]|nr:hypothetical protein [Muribaculaceae bacterium]
MKKIFYSLLVAAASVSFISCSSNNDEPEPNPNPNPDPDSPTETTINNFVVLNRGSKDNKINGSLSYFTYDGNLLNTTLTAFEDKDDSSLGINPNAMAVYDNKLFVCINEANRIDIIDMDTKQKVNQITFEDQKFQHPRQIWIDEDKAYISMYDDGSEVSVSGGYVVQYDCKTLEMLQYLPVGKYCNKPDGIVVVGNFLYIAYNKNLAIEDGFEDGTTVIRLDKRTDWLSAPEDQREPITVGLNPTDIVTNGTEIFVLCEGDGVKTRSQIWKITDNYVGKFFVEGSMMKVDDKYLYVINNPKNGVSPITYKRYSVVDPNDVTDMIDPEDGVEYPTSLTLDNETGNIIIGSAVVKDGVVSNTSNGYVNVYSKEGKKLVSGETGIDPFDILVLPKK